MNENWLQAVIYLTVGTSILLLTFSTVIFAIASHRGRRRTRYARQGRTSA